MHEAEDFNEESLARVTAELRSRDARLVLRPTNMVLRPDLTDEEVAFAHAVANYFVSEDNA